MIAVCNNMTKNQKQKLEIKVELLATREALRFNPIFNLLNMRLLRGRDIGFLIVFIIAVYISLKSPGFKYALRPAFYLNLQTELDNTHITGWSLLDPIITDIDADGIKEMLLISPSMSLKIYSAERPSTYDVDEVYIPEELNSIQLLKLNIKKGYVPVAMNTGYISPYSNTLRRTQVIVIVREDLTILCYDHKLRKLWEKSIAHKSHHISEHVGKYTIKEVSILISPLSVEGDEIDSGVVIIGASLGLRNEDDLDVAVQEEIDLDEMENSTEFIEAEDIDTDERSQLEHFSLYALSSKDGHVIWKHDGSDLRPEQYTKSLPQHAYKLDLESLTSQLHMGSGHADWTAFRASLTAELPHDWHRTDDTKMRIAHFIKRHAGADSNSGALGKGHDRNSKRNGVISRPNDKNNKSKQRKHSNGHMLSGEGSFIGFRSQASENAFLPHDASEHMSHPNVLVAHTSRGIDVVSLSNGAPITSLALVTGRTYADLDGDGLIDSILVLESKDDVDLHRQSFAHEEGAFKHCSIMVLSGLPARHELFNGSICSSPQTLDRSMYKSFKIPDIIGTASPLVLDNEYSNMQKRKTGARGKPMKDVILATNTGVITSYRGDGKFNFQLKTGPTWDLTFDQGSILAYDIDANRVDNIGTHSNRYAQVVVMGQDAITFISRDGEVLTSAEVPHIPLSRPIFADFDNDGVSDIMILTNEALLGYRMEAVASVRSLLIAFFFMAFIAIVVFIFSITDSSSNIAAGKIGMKLGTKRSTDDSFHLD